MIKVNKLDEPPILVKNGKRWTEEHLENIKNGIESSQYLKTRYNHSEIKGQIVKETNGKCVYCESKLTHIHHGDIEHIYPKSLDESKRFEWNNLTFACEICNQNKSNLDPKLTYIQDPYAVDAEKNFLFVGSLIMTKNKVGESTNTILELNRTALIERRNQRLKGLEIIFKQIINLELPQVVRQKIYQDLITIEAHDSSEYTAMIRCFIEAVKTQLPDDIIQNG